MGVHIKCNLWKFMWIMSVAFLISAWYSLLSKVALAGLDPLAWFWSALVLGVLCVPVKLDCHSCGTCNMK